MSILWCGGEDIDFPLGQAVITDTSSVCRRGSFTRAALFNSSSTTNCKSNAFPGGAVTSCWMSAQMFMGSGNTTGRKLPFGLANSSNGASLILACSAANLAKLALCTWNGTTLVQLATESGTSLSTNVIYKFDMQVVNYGASATVNVYINGILVITFTGNVAVLSNTNLDQVILPPGDSNSFVSEVSEIIVADEDTRGFIGLMSHTLTGAGTTDQWSGVFSTVNTLAISDTSPNSTNTTAQDQQFNLTDPVSGSYLVKAVKVAARLAVSSGSPTATQVKLGYNSGGTVAFGAGATKTPATAYTTFEQIDTVNPVTSAAFTPSELTALQVDLRSA
jgi:hypothetical protein